MSCRAGAGITPQTAHGVESSRRLGRHRYVIERTLEWITRFRRLQRRYERKAVNSHAFAILACAIVCYRQLLNKQHKPSTVS